MFNYQQKIIQSTKPYHILEEIVWQKQQEVTVMKEQLTLTDLKFQLNLAPTVRNFLNALRQNSIKPTIIAEVKKASPTKGVIRANFKSAIADFCHDLKAFISVVSVASLNYTSPEKM